MNNYNSGEDFIDKLYQNLINSEDAKKAIQRRGENPKNREETVKIYMERMQKGHNTPRKIQLLKSLYYKKYVIDHLPDSYVELQLKIAREEGHGNVIITNEIRKKMLDDIQEAQKKSIDRWLEYLNSDDAMYPMWFKFYAFQGMLKLGRFDKEKQKFTRRTKDTVSPFIEVNPEILGQMYTVISKMIEKKDITNEEIKLLENGESFQKLYTSILANIEQNRDAKKNSTNGIWVRFEQGSNYYDLWKSLQGKNTGWCIAGEQTCREYLERGDFYVYYTYDEHEKPVEPRIAIRMNGNKEIAEVRGVDNGQELDRDMIEVAEKKLKEFPNSEGKKYQKKAHDMKLLTKIERKSNDNEELDAEEIKFLYELDSDIIGFGWYRDPRIEEIKRKRNPKEDFKRLDVYTIINGLKRNVSLFRYITTDIPNYSELALEVVKQDGLMLEFVPKKTSNYSEIALEAVKKAAGALKYVSVNTSNYQEIISEALKQSPGALMYVSPDIPNYSELALESVKQNGLMLKFVPKNTFNYSEIALEAVKKNWVVLEYVPADTSNYQEIVSEALKQSSIALRYLSPDIPNYSEIALEVVKQDSLMLKFVPKNTFNYSEIALEAVKKNWGALEYVPADTSNYQEIISEALKQSPGALRYLSPDIPNYSEIALEVLKQSPGVLRYLSPDIPNYLEIALDIVKHHPSSIETCSPDMPYYSELALESVKQNPDELNYLFKPESIAIEAIKRGYLSLQDVSKVFSNRDYQLIKRKVKQDNEFDIENDEYDEYLEEQYKSI